MDSFFDWKLPAGGTKVWRVGNALSAKENVKYVRGRDGQVFNLSQKTLRMSPI